MVLGVSEKTCVTVVCGLVSCFVAPLFVAPFFVASVFETPEWLHTAIGRSGDGVMLIEQAPVFKTIQ